MKQRELKRKHISSQYRLKRNYLLKARQRVTNYSQQLEILSGLAALPRDSSATRKSNRCRLTGTSRAYNRFTGLSRYKLRELGHQSMIPGLIKASW